MDMQGWHYGKLGSPVLSHSFSMHFGSPLQEPANSRPCVKALGSCGSSRMTLYPYSLGWPALDENTAGTTRKARRMETCQV